MSQAMAPLSRSALITHLETHPERLGEYVRAMRSVDALARWRTTVETLPAVSPQVARSLTATERLWQAVDDEFGLLSAAELGRLLGSTAADPSSMVAKRQQSGKLLWVRRGGRLRYPAFQFDARQGEIYPAVPELVMRGAEHGFDGPQIVQWLLAPSAALGGDRPVDILGDTERVVAAADRAWATEW